MGAECQYMPITLFDTLIWDSAGEKKHPWFWRFGSGFLSGRMFSRVLRMLLSYHTYMPKMFEAVWSLPVLVLLIHKKYCWSKKDHNLFRVPQESYKDHFKADQGFSSSSGKHHDMIPWLLGCPGKNILVLPQVRHGRTADSKPKRGEVKCMLVVLMKPPTSGVYWIYWNWLCPTTGVPPLVCRKILQRWSS